MKNVLDVELIDLAGNDLATIQLERAPYVGLAVSWFGGDGIVTACRFHMAHGWGCTVFQQKWPKQHLQQTRPAAN